VTALLPLGEPLSTRPDLVGVKAAHLAVARRRGYPVLPGLIVPIDSGAPSIDAGTLAIADHGPAAGRRAAMATEIGPELRSDLERVCHLGARLVVRSSTLLDDDGQWSGAFASYADVRPDDVETAVRGCWASVFSPDALARLEHVSRTPAEVGMAVLIQPELAPTVSGLARVSGEAVEVSLIEGAPGALLAGQARGERVVVRSDAPLPRPSSELPISARMLRELAETSLRLAAEPDGDRFEWAVADGTLWILQVGRAGRRREEEATDVSTAYRGVAYARLARMIIGREGPLGDRLLVPWAAAAHEASTAATLEVMVGFSDAERLADELNHELASAVGDDVDVIARRLASGDSRLAERVAAVRVDGYRVSSLLEATAQVADRLTADGRLSHPSELWDQTPAWVHSALRGERTKRPSARPLGSRWSEAIWGTAVANGERLTAVPASPGRAPGTVTWRDKPDDVSSLARGSVLVIREPLPNFAPLLWKASGLIAGTGSSAAHLFEVARSIHVPAVIVPGLDPMSVRGSIVALDGGSGELWRWQP
jgi:hypothetical protein